MKIKLLSANDYSNPDANNGDCIIIHSGNNIVVYDCGCEEHAKRVESYMKSNNCSKAIAILSHNDSDHFDGFEYLVNKNLISKLWTHLFLKYKDDILDLIQDKRLKRETVGTRLEEIYDNVKSLGGKVPLGDAFECPEIIPGVSLIGPSKDYALNAIAKRIDKRQSDQIDKETVVNAVSVQTSVDLSTEENALFCGDCSFESIKDIISDYTVIQLPHHGKADTAKEIFEAKFGENDTVYLVSDNTGNSNGGSDGRCFKGKNVKSTRDGDIVYPTGIYSSGSYTKKTLGNLHFFGR